MIHFTNSNDLIILNDIIIESILEYVNYSIYYDLQRI